MQDSRLKLTHLPHKQVGNEFSSVEALWSQFENFMGREDENESGEKQEEGQQEGDENEHSHIKDEEEGEEGDSTIVKDEGGSR